MTRPLSFVHWLVWHVAAGLAVLSIPARIWLDSLPFDDAKFAPFFVGAAAMYAAGVAILTRATRRGATIGFTGVAGAMATVAAIFLLFLIGAEVAYSRVLIAAVLTMTGAAFVIPLLLDGKFLLAATGTVAGLTAASFALPHVGSATTPEAPAFQRARHERVLSTSYYYLLATFFRNYTGPVTTIGGGLSRFQERFLLVTGSGQFHLLDYRAASRDLDVAALPLEVPWNRDEFVADLVDSTTTPEQFRTGDVLVRDSGPSFSLFVAHHYWNRASKCITLRVSTTNGTFADFEATASQARWSTLFESSPCLPLSAPGALHQMGGRLELLNERELIVTIGDHQLGGLRNASLEPQDPTTSYGKIVLIDTETGKSLLYSSGHRNPEGLYVTDEGAVWETEHGPKGGDELNLIERGANYGWPLVTYGTLYEKPAWPLGTEVGEHRGFIGPVQAWVPSIGPSALVALEGDAFSVWRGDLIVGSLVNRALRRIQVRDGRPVVTERLELGERVRDVIEDPDGRLILWTENQFEVPTEGSIVILEPLEGVDALVDRAGALIGDHAIVATRCGPCHSLDATGPERLAPTLAGVLGRDIASLPGYAYSQGLEQVVGEWTRVQLDSFITDPQSFAPGTTMQFQGVWDADERARIIASLSTR